MPLHPRTIQNIRDFDSLTDYLRDELDWPLFLDADLEQLSFSYNHDELQISEDSANKLEGGEIKQLRAMTEDQPWGVFFVRFDSEKFYASALREILRKLVKTSANRASFQPDDLIFVCANKNFEQFTFAHFEKRESGNALLETFGWKRGDAHVRTLCEHNFPQLKWRDSFENDADEWRKTWRSAFDVSVVTQKFFDEYEAHFRKVETSVAGFANDDAGKKARNAWTQKLFNRLLFIAFVQKKGWMTPPSTSPQGHNYLEHLWFEYSMQVENGNSEPNTFYSTRLQPLFAALNTRNATITDFVGKVPYLNGGLFDTDEDGHTDPGGLKVSDEAIHAVIFELFARYNFTVEESTPLDVQVAVDPEMLGKVFEKLILQRDRSAKGSFYTPRVVVTFMCRESLKRFLGDEYAPLIERGDTSGISIQTATDLLHKLETLRVVDPACGSGAYLLGMLHELFVLNKNLDTRADRANARDDYRRKLDIIQKNLYGVDLDSFAVHIARLRLWLSLVVEFDASGGDIPEPLPNLDFKIEIGNSLTAPDPSAQNPNLYRQRIVECERLKIEYSNYHEGGKREKAAEIEAIRKEISDWLRAAAPITATDNGEPFDWLARFGEVFLARDEGGNLKPENDVSSTRSSSFTFHNSSLSSSGFDIVLANPPYGSDIAENVRWNFFNRASDGSQAKDPYSLFIARGLQLLKPGGCLCFIVSNTWRTLKSHKPLRKRLAANTRVAHFIDLPRWIFDATVDTGILTTQKGAPDDAHTLIAADLAPLAKNDWNSLEANLEAVAAHGPDAQTLDYARYTFAQKLIESYDNASFFIGSPKLYALMSDARFEKLGAIADVKQGLATADNHYYLRQRAEVRGTYRVLDESFLLRDEEIANLSDAEKRDGVDPQTYEGRHFVPYDKGGESDAQGGWLPNYFVPTGYFIDWSQAAVTRLRTATIADVKRRKGEEDKIKNGDETTRAAVIRNPQFYWRKGLTFSPTGEYSPTLRLGTGTIFGNKGSTIFLNEKTPEVILAFACNGFARYLWKSFDSHTVETGEEVISRLILPTLNDEQTQQLETLVSQIIEKQKSEPRYAYHLHEQREIDALVYELYALSADDIREIELWYCRRYRKLADAQGVTHRVLEQYEDWLERAQMLRAKPYRYWSSHPWLREIGRGEGDNCEFKRQFAHCESKIVEAVTGFLNGDGGVLFVGVSDAGEPVGLGFDLLQHDTPNIDKLVLKMRQKFETSLAVRPLRGVRLETEPIGGTTLMRIEVAPLRGATPIYADNRELYVRDGNRTLKLEGAAAARWIAERATQL